MSAVERLPGARTEPLGAIAVKGKEAPVEVHRLLGLASANGPVARPAGGDERERQQ